MIPYSITNVIDPYCKVLPNNILLKSMKSALQQFLTLHSHYCLISISFCVTEDPDLRSVTLVHSGTVLNESNGHRI